MPHADELADAIMALATLPNPADCPFLDLDEIVPMRPEACPSDFESCGGIRRRKQEEQERKRQEELERKRKDSGIAGMEDSSEISSFRSSTTDGTWDDCAVSEESVHISRGLPSVPTDGLATNNKWFREYIEPKFGGPRWRPVGPGITYLPEYVEAGPRVLEANRRNMNQPWAVSIGRPSELNRKKQLEGRQLSDIVQPVQREQLANSDTSVITKSRSRESNEPDETHLLIMGYHLVPEIREEWEEKRRKNPQPERPVVTVPDAIEEVFRIVK